MFSRGPESMKNQQESFFSNRTKNQHRCPWVRSPRCEGIIRLRELGKIAPCLRNKGSLHLYRKVQAQGAVTRRARLFNKNLTDCNAARLSIVGDVCPVQVLQTPLQWG